MILEWAYAAASYRNDLLTWKLDKQAKGMEVRLETEL